MQGWILSIVLSTIIGFGVYKFYTDTQDTIAQLNKDNAQLIIAAKTSAETITRLEKDSAEYELALKALNVKYNRSEQYNTDLLTILRSHDLAKLVAAKPGLMEKRFNDGTEQVFEDLRIITGTKPE